MKRLMSALVVLLTVACVSLPQTAPPFVDPAPPPPPVVVTPVEPPVAVPPAPVVDPPIVVESPPVPPVATLAVVAVDFVDPWLRIADAQVFYNDELVGTTDAEGYLAIERPLGRQYEIRIRKLGYSEGSAGEFLTANSQVGVHLTKDAPPIPPHPAPIVGQLGTDGDRCFVDRTGCRVVSVYHAGDMFALFAAGYVAEVREDLAAVSVAGYQIVRSWVSLNDGADPGNVWAGPRYLGVGPRITPDYQAELVAFARLLDEYGLKWHMAAGGIDAMTTAVEEAMFRAWADAMAEAGPEKWALVEACNECRDTSDRNGDNTPAHLERLITIVRSRHPQVLYTLTAYTGTEDPRELGPYNGYRHLGDRADEHRSPIMEFVPGSPGSSHRFIYYHGYRGQQIDDKIRHRVSMALESGLGRLYWDGEPGGPWSALGVPGDRLTQVSAQDGDSEYDDESVTAMAMGSVIGRGVHAFMSSTGVRRYVSPTTFPGFATIPRLFRKIPQDAHTGTLVHAGRSNSPIEPTTNSAGHLGRADSLLLADGRVVSLFYGERPGVFRFRLRQGLTGVLIHPGTAEETPIDLKAGETLAINMQWARVFVGRVQ